MTSEWIDVGASESVNETTPLSAEVDGIPVVVVRCGAEVYAVEDRCTHDGEPLGEGRTVGPETGKHRGGEAGQIRRMRITKAHDYDLTGELTDEPADSYQKFIAPAALVQIRSALPAR